MLIDAGRPLLHLIGDPRGFQPGRHPLHVRVGPEKHGAAFPRLQPCGDASEKVAVLPFPVRKSVEAHRTGAVLIARLRCCLQLLQEPVPVLLDDVQGSLDNLRLAPVVHVQQQLPGFVLRLEALEAFRTGAPETVDGLVVVPHGKDIVRAGGKQPHRLILHRIDVLELVDEDVSEPVLPVRPDSAVLL